MFPVSDSVELQLESLKGKLMEADSCKGDDPNSTKETSIVENSNNVEVGDTGGESNIDIKPFSDITLLFKENDKGMEKIDIKPLRVLVLNEKEGFFGPDIDSSANMLTEDKKPPHQIFTQLAQSSSSMKYPSINNPNIVGGEGSHDQGLMHLAEALYGMGIPSKACQQLFRIDEGYLHEEACNIFVNVEEQGASSSLPWWDYWL